MEESIVRKKKKKTGTAKKVRTIIGRIICFIRNKWCRKNNNNKNALNTNTSDRRRNQNSWL